LKEKPWVVAEKNEHTSIRGVLRNFPKPLIAFLIINMIFAIGNSSDAFIILRTQGLGFTMISTILVYALFNFTYASFSVPAGIVSDKIGPRNILVLGLMIFSVVYLLFGYATTPLFIWILFPLYGVYMALTDGVSKAYISNIVPGEILGTAYGIYQFAIGFCAFFASLIAGFLWTKVGEQAPFIFGGVMALIAALLLVLIGPKGKTITTE
jgi:MFS family permease